MIKQFVRRNTVDRLPANSQLVFFRNYFYWCKGDYVKPEVDLFRRLCNSGKAALDIGANEGLYSMYLCQFATELVCFEPLPWMGEHLAKKFRGTRNVRVENCALGSKNETTIIRIPVTKGRQYDTRSSLVGNFDAQLIDGEPVVQVKEVPVAVKRLDDFNLQNIGFIKIDVEGFELEVLKGASETITRNRPNLYVEIEQKHHKDGPISGVLDFVLQLGYDGFFQRGRELLPLQRSSMSWGEGGNFVFLPKEKAANGRSNGIPIAANAVVS